MDPGKLEYYEFLDLSDIDENERRQLKQTLYSEGTPDFLQLPWTRDCVAEEWQKLEYCDNNSQEQQHVPNGPLDAAPALSPPPLGLQMGAQHHPSIPLYPPPPPAQYTVPPPQANNSYQHPPNVFVSNVTANVNVHGFVTGHYVPPHYNLAESSAEGRGHRGRSRGRGNKRDNRMVDGGGMVENSPPGGYNQPFVPIHYHPGYYTQPVGSPMQHPNAQHATGSPLYITPVYTHLYGAYHPQQYYPQPVVEDAPVEMNPQQMYHEQPVDEDDEEQYELSETNVIESNDLKPMTNDYEIVNNNLVQHLQQTQIIEVIEPPIAELYPPTEQYIHPTTEQYPTAEVLPPTIELVHTITPPQLAPIIHTEPPPPVKKEPIIISAPEPQAPIVNNAPRPIVNKSPVPEVVSSPPSKSWASLFNSNRGKASSAPPVPSVTNDVEAAPLKSIPKPLGVVSPFPKTAAVHEEKQTERREDRRTSSCSYSNDPNSLRMGEFLSKYSLDNRTVSLQPRGLSNRSNYCYINSILQALLACPPFYNLLKALPHQPRKNPNAKSSTPIIDAMIEFVNEFTPLSAESRLNRKEKGQRKDNIDVICGAAFEPSRIYKILNGIRTDTFIVEGRQEDAEEFFGCLLNGLNDEMLELVKLVDDVESHSSLSNGDIVATNGETHDSEEVEWKVMGPKNKGSITRRADFGRTPISDIFRGQLRSRVHRTGDQITDNVQPFFTLQLDIEKASSVYEALELLVNKDKLEGVTCSRTNQQVEAWQQVTLEELPLVMVLHLKCFNYKIDGCSKIIKPLEFPIDLKIDSKLLSAKLKYGGKQKQYKLFAVVYHDGKEASKGHYLTDAYHVGYGGWVRYDDAVVKSVQEQHVLHPNAARVPYLLYYRRCDTIGNQLPVHAPKRD